MIKVHHLFQEQTLALSLEEAWAFFATPKNLDEITPPELSFETVYCAEGEMFEGQIITYRVGIFPGVKVPWVTEIRSVKPRESFIDEQRAGPYRLWHHRHVFTPIPGGVGMTDEVHYALPFWPFGELAHGILVKPKLERIFAFRREELEKRFGRVEGQVC